MEQKSRERHPLSSQNKQSTLCGQKDKSLKKVGRQRHPAQQIGTIFLNSFGLCQEAVGKKIVPHLQ